MPTRNPEVDPTAPEGILLTSDTHRIDVFAEERQQHIARIVEEHGRARVAELATMFRVSGVTIRKDLDVLERHGRRSSGPTEVPSPRAAAARSARSTSANGSSAPRRTRSGGPRPRW